jgi:EAL domain-containing protein (putative c-di-GMP-specific phosphodiesterase class I)/GGDEF domain-containing protein
MDSSCLARFFSKKTLSLKNLLAFLLALFAVPAFASQHQFSFTEYNLAFVLGLSLPVLLITALLNKKISIAWGFPALLTLSIFSLLYSMANFARHQSTFSLTAAIVFLALMYLWPFYNQTEQQLKSKRTFIVAIVSTTLIYLISIWFLPQIDAYLTWLLSSALILTLALVRIIQLQRQQKPSSYRIIIQWLFALTFSISIYLWLSAKISINTLTLLCVLTYLTALINGSWLLVQQIISDISAVDEQKIEKITHHDLFSYTHDPATHLPTYQHALKHFAQLLQQNSHPDYAIIALQPIDFIEVNSILGHQNSDVLLLQLAYCLQQKTAKNNALINFEQNGETTKLARLQGLRFLIIVDLSASHHPDRAVINDICKQLALSVPKAMSFKSFSLNFELVFGVSLIKTHGEDINKVIAHAEDALLNSQNKKQTINYFDSSQLLHTEQQLAKMEALKAAITGDQLQWYIQPQILLANKAIQGFALSVYWHNELIQSASKTKKLTLNQFIKTAELSGDIFLLARKMITEAFKLLFKLHQGGCYQVVSVNLSSKFLLEPDLIDFIEQRSLQYNIPTKYLSIELSEQLIIFEKDQAKIFIDQLKALEINLTITQFSGSYDALRFLRKVIVNQIQIDCQQLTDKEEMATDKAITNALINLASTMNIPIVATGVDNTFIEQVFTAMGGKIAQGKAIVDNVKLDNIDGWLSAWYQQYPKIKPD